MKNFKNKLNFFISKYGTLILNIILEIVLICCTTASILKVVNGQPHLVTFIIYITLDAALFLAIAVEIALILRKNKNDRS